MNEKENNRKKALELAISQIQKQFGEGSIMPLGQQASIHTIDIIKTGSISLDLALGIGGIPKGRIVEIYGPESSGKSTLALHFVANAQKKGGLAAYIDAEHALDPSYAKKIGINIDELMISQPDSGEEALNITDALAKSNALDIIIIDSVAALVPKCELAGEIGDSFMGVQARMMSQALRKLASTLSKSNTCAVFINQIREKIGIMFGNPETTTGGRALKFYASTRLDIRRIGSIKNSDNKDIGNRVKVKVVKNKLAPPFQTTEFDIMFNKGISREGSLLDTAVQYGIIEKKGSWFSYKDRKLGQGREPAKEEIRKDEKMAKELEEKIYEAFLSQKKEPIITQ